jgi:hypothetical protein
VPIHLSRCPDRFGMRSMKENGLDRAGLILYNEGDTLGGVSHL